MARLLRRVFGWTSAPSAPTIVSVEATSSTSISIQWNASKKDGGSPITGYVVDYHSASDPALSFETQAVARDVCSMTLVEYHAASDSFETRVVRHNVFSTTLDGLTPSTEYDVRVRAENAVGHSVPSATMRAKTDDQVEERVNSEEDMLSFFRDLEDESRSVGNLEEEETNPRVQEESLKTLRESIRRNDADSFYCHLDELKSVVQNNEQIKVLLEQDGTLCLAAHVGSNPVVDTLIQKGVDINTMSRVPEHPEHYWKMSPLHWAADGGHVDTVKCLTEKGAEVNCKDECRDTPLHLAAFNGFTDTVQCLIEKGAEINIKDNSGDTPLHLAALNGHTDTVQYLTEKGANISVKNNDWCIPLDLAARKCQTDTVQYLTEKEAEIYNERILLYQAACNGRTDIVKYLTEKGTEIKIKDNKGRTLLHQAAFNGHTDTVEYLTEKGADVNIEDNEGWTPLHRAALQGHVDTVKYLVEKCTSMHSKLKEGWTPLHLAAEQGHVDIVKCLVEKGANIHGKIDDGKIPLDLATQMRHEEVVTYLKRAADSNMLEESESIGRQQECRQSAEETDNSSSEQPPPTAEKEEETDESDHEEIDSQLVNLLEKYRQEPKIKHKSLKCLFTGPPRVGKTTLKKRLLRVIKNLITSGVVSPSGGLEKPISVVIGETRKCVTVVMENWQPQHDLLDEAQIVLEFIDKSHHQSLPTPGPTPTPPKPVPPTPVSIPAMSAPAAPIATTAVPSKSDPDPPTPREGEADTLDNTKKLMREVLSSRKLRSIKDIEKTTTLYFMDTGGQPEFHEIMPLVLSGPALHMIFFNLTFDLDDPIPIQFCHQDSTNSTITYVSSYTGKQMIFQLLSSLYYFSKGLSPDSEPTAVLIGTHLDQLKGQDEMKINDALNRLLSNVEFHDQGFLTYPTRDKSKVFTPVNNYSGEEEEIHQLQAFLREVIDNRFSAVELPSSWLFFHLLLRHRYENLPGVCTLSECQELAKGCHLDEKDVPQVLRYIHQHLGTILFYEEVPGLNKLVICDPNVLFESIYQLVAVSFGGSRNHHTSAAELRKTGEIPSKVLERITSQPSSSLLTNEHIIELLKHFKILTEFVSDERIAYFMPCLLHPNNSLELSCEALKVLWPPSLLVRFNGNYIPIGVFSALVVKLSESSWEPDRETRYRNHILFHTDGVFPVELIVHPAYLEFRIRITNYKEEEPKDIHEFCMVVRKRVVDTLKAILGLHQHTKKAKFQLGFYCPGSFQSDSQPHFCGCLPRQNLINPKAFVCSKSPQCQDQCRLPHECTIWFEYWKDKESDGDQDQVNISVGNTSKTAGALAALAGSTTANTLSMKPTLTQLTRMKTTTGEKIKIIESVSPQWKKLGDLLNFDPEGRTLELIEANNHLNGVVACCREMFVTWLKGNGREATWEMLIELLDDSDQSELARKIKTALH